MAKSKKTTSKKKVTSKTKTNKPKKSNSKSKTSKKVVVEVNKVKAIVKKIIEYAKSESQSNKSTDNFPLWYAGIANNPAIRIVGHKRKLKVKELPTFKPFDAETYANARAVEDYLCKNHQFRHCDRVGGPNKDNHESPSRYTYVYFIPPQSREK